MFESWKLSCSLSPAVTKARSVIRDVRCWTPPPPGAHLLAVSLVATGTYTFGKTDVEGAVEAIWQQQCRPLLGFSAFKQQLGGV